MKVTAERITAVQVVITLTEDEARGTLNALGYFNTMVGGNNFEMGYRGEDPSVMREHKAAKALANVLARKLDQLDR